jgi:hypothetical protein
VSVYSIQLKKHINHTFSMSERTKQIQETFSLH